MLCYVFAFLIVIIRSVNALTFRPSQAVGVRGVLLCQGKPATNIKVKLYDHDTFTLDDKIGEDQTDSDGHFEISGHANEFTSITPKLNIYHDCDDDWLPCQRKVSIYIPKSMVSRGETVENFFDAGTLELSGRFAGEERGCFH